MRISLRQYRKSSLLQGVRAIKSLGQRQRASTAGDCSTTSTLTLFSASDIEQIHWPSTELGHYHKNLLLPLMKHGLNHYIDNIQAVINILAIDDQLLPLTIVDTFSEQQAYTCSVYGHYIGQGLKSLSLIENPLFRRLARHGLKGLGKLMRWGQIHKTVYINHWPFSTDLHSQKLTEEQVQQIVDFLQQRFPHHALVWRSIDRQTNPLLFQNMQKSRCHLIASRQIFLTDTNQTELFETRIIKSDMRLWQKFAHHLVEPQELDSSEIEQICHIYHTWIIEHHSALNPQFNAHFIKLLLEKKLLHFKLYVENGQIEGFIGYIHKGDLFHCPFIGFNKNHHDHQRIYRLLSTLLLQEAAKEKRLFHQSAGASFYKKVRRAQAEQEYFAIFTRHLSWRKRISWHTLKLVMNKIAMPLMRKY